MNKSICILIPVFNEIKYTQQCIANLKNCISKYREITSDHYEIEIVVIDDGSTDGTSEWLKEKHPDVGLCFGDGNLFWSASINLGIKYALSKPTPPGYILFWSKDLFIEPEYLHLLSDHIRNCDEKSIIASKMYRKSTPNILFSYGGLYNPVTNKKVNLGAGKEDGEEFKEVKDIDWCGGMAVCFPIGLFREIGDCDSQNFPQYDGDTDLCLRAKTAGYKIVLYPELKVWNMHENTGRKEKYNFKNLRWYLKDIRSYRNFKISYTFMRKHSKGPLAPIMFFISYVTFISKYSAKILLSVLK